MELYIYVCCPFFAWLVAGVIKFIVNCIKEKKLAFELIGYGGFPSNHTSIVSSALTIVFLKEGLDSPILAVAVALTFIVMLDASSLRRQVGLHAVEINQLTSKKQKLKPLRERIGHTRIELIGGLIVGFLSAYLLFYFS